MQTSRTHDATRSHLTKESAGTVWRRRWGMLVLCSASMVVMVGVTSINIALPDVQADLRASDRLLTWIVDSYTLALASVLLIAGALGDRFGRRGVLQVGVALFVTGSVVPVALDGSTELLVGRIVSGVGAGLILPSTLSLIPSMYPPESRRVAVGVWAASLTLGGIVGMLLGGLLLEHLSWPSIFVASAAFAAMALVLSPTLPTWKDPERSPIDVAGALLGALFVGLVVYTIIESSERGWGARVSLLLWVVAAVVLLAFIMVELRGVHPLLDVVELTNRVVGSSILFIFLAFALSFGLLFIAGQYLQVVLGFSPLQAGLGLAPMGVPIILLAPASQAIGTRFSLRSVFAVGSVFMIASMAVFATLDVDSGYPWFGVGGVLLGMGLGISMPPSTTSVMDALPEHKQGVASSLNDAAREVAAALGIALAGSLIITGKGEPRGSGTAAEALLAGRQGFSDGAHDAFVVFLLVTVVLCALVVAMAPGRRSHPAG
ncbi:MAG: putative drug resistance efflux protein [Aeromicrobium sp.]|nr:putative drug resistance efflux protein [Aeromicrobium sp.]